MPDLQKLFNQLPKEYPRRNTIFQLALTDDGSLSITNKDDTARVFAVPGGISWSHKNANGGVTGPGINDLDIHSVEINVNEACDNILSSRVKTPTDEEIKTLIAKFHASLK